MIKLSFNKLYIRLICMLTCIFLSLMFVTSFLSRLHQVPPELNIGPYVDWIKSTFHQTYINEVGIPVNYYPSQMSWYYSRYTKVVGTPNLTVGTSTLDTMECYVTYTDSYYCLVNLKGGPFRLISVTGDSLGLTIILYPQSNTSYIVGNIIHDIDTYDGYNNDPDLAIRKNYTCIMPLGKNWKIFIQGNYCRNLLMRQVKTIVLRIKPEDLPKSS